MDLILTWAENRYSDFINSGQFQQNKEDNMLFQYLDTQTSEKRMIDAKLN